MTLCIFKFVFDWFIIFTYFGVLRFGLLFLKITQFKNQQNHQKKIEKRLQSMFDEKVEFYAKQNKNCESFHNYQFSDPFD